CCSTAATGSAAIQRAVSASARSCQVMSSQSRFGSMGRALALACHERAATLGRARRRRKQRASPPAGQAGAPPLFSPACQQETAMRLARPLQILGAIILAGAAAHAAGAQALDKVSFGTNWVAEAEHGGFYQALADGTYRRYGLDVTIVPGGPQ